jgi:hypothetical protein
MAQALRLRDLIRIRASREYAVIEDVCAGNPPSYCVVRLPTVFSYVDGQPVVLHQADHGDRYVAEELTRLE